jgi:hypothetical protein
MLSPYHKLLRFMQGLILTGLGLGLVLFVLTQFLDDPPWSVEPPLARNLPAAYQEGGVLFDHRVVETFPVGTPESTVIETLLQQGFHPTATPSLYAFEKRHSVCQLVWQIAWETDPATQAIRAIHGTYNGICP